MNIKKHVTVENIKSVAQTVNHFINQKNKNAENRIEDSTSDFLGKIENKKEEIKSSIDHKVEATSATTKTKIAENAVWAIQKGGKISRTVAIGATREIINRNPVTTLASHAVLGAAKSILPKNNITDKILEVTHEIVHGEPMKHVSPEIDTKKQKFYKNIPYEFIFGVVITAFISFVFKGRKK